MTIAESLLVALFCISMVFFVLLCLCVLIKLFSLAIRAISGRKKETLAVESLTVPAAEESSGVIKLHSVDEPTAAMIMAIVSDESGIPLSELCFKSIKLVQQK